MWKARGVSGRAVGVVKPRKGGRRGVSNGLSVLEKELEVARREYEDKEVAMGDTETLEHVQRMWKLKDAIKEYKALTEEEAQMRKRYRHSSDWKLPCVKAPGQQRLTDFSKPIVVPAEKRRGKLLETLSTDGVLKTFVTGCNKGNGHVGAAMTVSATTGGDDDDDDGHFVPEAAHVCDDDEGEHRRFGNTEDGNGNTIMSDNAYYGDVYVHRSPAYKAINHFNDLLNRVQGGTKEKMPEENREAVLAELRKRRLDAPTPKQVREAFKVTGNNAFYGEVISVWAKLNGQVPPQFSSAQIQRLQRMFNCVHDAYRDVRPKKRKNFLSYTYTLYKMCELLGFDFVLPYVSLLKSNDKLKQHDEVWARICDHLDWQFLPTNRIR